ncbi:MAG TPA: hypothetical protein VJS42_09280 [Steroidobacteraceae bacterium]|nr:hypothetical protein [Steroidobacteraceae bacterium]
MLPVELDESGADSSVLLMSELLLELSLLESIEPSELELLSLGMLEEDDEDAASSSGWLPLVLLCDSSTRALRDVVLVLVRVSVLAASERSFVTGPISELELVVSDVEADGVVLDGEPAPVELELVLGTVALLLVEGGTLLEDEDGAVPSAVRHSSVLRRVSVDVVVDCEGVVAESVEDAVLSVGVFVALGVFAVEEGAGVVCVVVDSATCVCS